MKRRHRIRYDYDAEKWIGNRVESGASFTEVLPVGIRYACEVGGRAVVGDRTYFPARDRCPLPLMGR